MEEIGAPRAVLRCLREAAANGVAVREVELERRLSGLTPPSMDRGEDGIARNGGAAGIILAVQGHNRAPLAWRRQVRLRLGSLPRAQDRR
jgi:hypothetical protein